METEPTEEDIDGTPAPRKSRIGLVVFGSLFAGLLVAVVLIAFPLAHSRENVITGTVLLSFAFGWTALTAGSERWTDQPQRWAWVPAGFMALAGVSVLLAASTSDRLEWVWPPLLLALVVWMIVRARRDLHTRTRPWLLYPVFAVLVLMAIGGAYEAVGVSADGGKYAMPGRLVDVGGHRLHLYCTGVGSPTVVLEPGLGEPSPMMSGWIAPDVARGTRVCVYDRAGRGWSESASGPEDGVQVATELHTLLDRAHVNGPYVLAGHSAGGAYALNFAHLYPDQVAGVVLLDSMHPDQYTKLPGWSSFYAKLRRTSPLFPSLARLGVGRLAARSATSGLPPQARGEERAFNSTPRAARSLRDEAAKLRTALEQAGALTSLGARPLIVVTAARDAQRGWLPLQDDLATLSTNSVHRVLANATHASLTEDQTEASKAAEAILDVVTAVRTDQPLGKS